jgi:hypothetical protein
MSALFQWNSIHRAKADACRAAAASCQDAIEAQLLARLADLHGEIANAIASGQRDHEAIFHPAEPA